MYVTVALMCWAVGALMKMAATFFFRHPDVPFTWLAVWRSPKEFYVPTGRILSRTGSILIVVGFIVMYIIRPS